MNIVIQILFFFLASYTNLDATTVFTKVDLPTYELSFSKIEKEQATAPVSGGASLSLLGGLAITETAILTTDLAFTAYRESLPPGENGYDSEFNKATADVLFWAGVAAAIPTAPAAVAGLARGTYKLIGGVYQGTKVAVTGSYSMGKLMAAHGVRQMYLAGKFTKTSYLAFLTKVNGAGSLFSKLDNLGLTALKTEINLLDDVGKSKFLDEFAGASDDALRAMNGNTSLVNYWKANSSIIKGRSYPNVGHKAWDDTKNAIITKADPIETKILNSIESQFITKPLTNNQPVMAGAYCDEIGGNVFVKYNLSPVEKASFNYNSLDPIIKDHIDYLNFIRQDALNNGKLYEKLYAGVSKDKLIAAGDAASHAEILALDEVVKSMRAQGKFNSTADLSKIQILVIGKAEWGNMCRCPHCYQLSNGVKMIGNE